MAQVQAKLQKTAAAGIDPKQHVIDVVMTDGTKFQINTTWGKEGDVLRLDVDPKNDEIIKTNFLKLFSFINLK